MPLKFELSAESKTILIKEGEQQETYSIMEVPSDGSLLVQNAAARLYGRMNPVTLYNNLSICADLFEVTYDAVNSIEGLQSSIWSLRQSLNKSAIDSADFYVRDFLNRCMKIPQFYKAGVKAIFSEPVNGDQALKAFSFISQEAGKISDSSRELVERFEKLESEASSIITEMIEQRALDVKQKNQLKENVALLNSRMDGLKAVQSDLESDIEELTEKYNALDKKIDRASKQQFALSMTSAVFGAIGTGLSAYTSTTTAGTINNISKNVAGAVSSEKQNASIESTQSRLGETNEKISTLEKRISEKKKELEEKDQQISEETDEVKKEGLLKEKENLTREIEQAEAEKNALQAEAKSYTDVINGLSAGLSSLSGNLGQQASELSDTVTALTSLADNILEQRSALKKEKREILRQVAEYTKTIENSVVTKNSLDLAIAAVSAGIGALNYIISVLNDFYTFWLSVKSQTANMAEGEVENYISLFQDMPEELHSIEFYTMIASNAAQWAALKIVLTDYQKAFYRVSDKIQSQLKVKEESDPELMWKRAIELSKGMSNIIRIQEENI